MSRRRNEPDYDSEDEHENRVRGGQKAAETRRKRGTGYFENNSREKQAELGRKGGSIGGRHNKGGEHYNESYEERRERGLKAAKTREERGTDFFKNARKDGRLSEIGRRGGKKGGARSFGDQSDQDEDEQDAYEPSRQSRYEEDDDEDDYSQDSEDDEGDYHGKNPKRVQGGKRAAETRKKRGTARGN